MGFPIHRRKGSDISKCSHGPAPYLGPVGLTAIFHNLDPTGVRFRHNGRNITSLSNRMDDHRGLGIGINPFKKLFNSDIITAWHAIHQARNIPIQNNGTNRSRIRQGRHQNFTPLGKLKSRNRDKQGRRSRRHGVGISPIHHGDKRLGIHLLKGPLITGITTLIPIKTQYLLDHLHFGWSKRFTERHGKGSDRRTAMNRQLGRMQRDRRNRLSHQATVNLVTLSKSYADPTHAQRANRHDSHSNE